MTRLASGLVSVALVVAVAAGCSSSISSDDAGNVATVERSYGDCLAGISVKPSDLFGDIDRDGKDVVRVHGQLYLWHIGELADGTRVASPDTYTYDALVRAGCPNP